MNIWKEAHLDNNKIKETCRVRAVRDETLLSFEEGSEERDNITLTITLCSRHYCFKMPHNKYSGTICSRHTVSPAGCLWCIKPVKRLYVPNLTALSLYSQKQIKHLTELLEFNFPFVQPSRWFTPVSTFWPSGNLSTQHRISWSVTQWGETMHHWLLYLSLALVNLTLVTSYTASRQLWLRTCYFTPNTEFN